MISVHFLLANNFFFFFFLNLRGMLCEHCHLDVFRLHVLGAGSQMALTEGQ